MPADLQTKPLDSKSASVLLASKGQLLGLLAELRYDRIEQVRTAAATGLESMLEAIAHAERELGHTASAVPDRQVSPTMW